MATPPGNSAGRSNSSGEFMGPPRPEGWINPKDGTLLTTAYTFIYGLWLRTGAGQAPANAGGVGIKALQFEIDALSVLVDEAFGLSLLSGDDTIGQGTTSAADSMNTALLFDIGEGPPWLNLGITIPTDGQNLGWNTSLGVWQNTQRIIGSNAPSGSAIVGNAVTITAGSSDGSNPGAAVNITAGIGGNTNGPGGSLNLVGGAGIGNTKLSGSIGGPVNITGGSSVSQTGGAVTITGGVASATNNFAGGTVAFIGGASGASATGKGGDAAIFGGAAASANGDGGSVFIAGGVATGSGTPGHVEVLSKLQVSAPASMVFLEQGISNGITLTGSTQAGALLLTNGLNVASSVPTGTGAELPAIGTTVDTGAQVALFNMDVNTGTVYANGSQTIDTIAGSIGVSLSGGNRCLYIANTGSTWISAQLGAKSS